MYKKIAEKTYIVPETACIPRIVKKLQPRPPNAAKGGRPFLFIRIALLYRAGDFAKRRRGSIISAALSLQDKAFSPAGSASETQWEGHAAVSRSPPFK